MRHVLAVLISTLPLAAGATEPEAPALRDIPVEEWTAMAAGRTLTYTLGGELWALERYHPGSNRVTLQFHDGGCLEGVWEHDASLYCFHWEGEAASCFRHAFAGDRILVMPMENGVQTGATQIMSEVTDTPLSCGPPPIS